MPEQHEKTLIDMAVVGSLGFGLGALFKVIGMSRYDRQGEPITARQFAMELIGAGGVGMLAAWILDGFALDREWCAVIIAMCGYVGGPLLDICYKQIQKTLDAAFEGLQKYLSEGKWQK